MRGFRRASGQGLACAAAGVLAGFGTAEAASAAKPRADLKVAKVTVTQASVPAGVALPARVTVRNVGRRKAGRSALALLLSTDRKRSKGDIALTGTARVKALARRKRAATSPRLVVPGSTPAGRYHLLACADGAGKLRERSEKNNCRASGALQVLAAVPGPGGPFGSLAPAPAAGTGSGPAGGGPSGGGPSGGGPSGGSGPDGGGPDGPAPVRPAGDFDGTGSGSLQTPDPLSVTHTLETSRAVTQRVETFGGTVTTTSADGTTYRLEVPSGALLSAADITMTPVAKVNSSPLGDLVGAVEILPHGLELMKAATLTIEPAGSAGPVAGQTAFLSHESGEDFHLYPFALDDGLKLHLTHFSTPGVAQATAAERQVVLSHPPERHRAQYEQQFAEVVRQTRAAQVADENTPLPADTLAELFRGYYRDVVYPVVEQAYTDDAVASRAISELLGWARQIELLSLEEHPRLRVLHDAVWPNVEHILENAMRKGYDRCVNDHDLDYIVRLIGLARVGALLGLTLEQDAMDRAERCANFEVRFDSRIDYRHYHEPGDAMGQETEATWHVEMTAPIGITGLTTNATMRFKDFRFHEELWMPCGDNGELRLRQVGTTTRPDTKVMLMLGIDLNHREPGTAPPPDRDIQVRMFHFDDISETYEQTTVRHCGTPPPPADPIEENRWKNYFDGLHVDEFGRGFENWVLGSGDLVASKSYDRSVPNHGVTEKTRVELWHKPLK